WHCGGAHGNAVAPSCVQHVSRRAAESVGGEHPFMEDPMDEDFYRVDTSSENEIRIARTQPGWTTKMQLVPRKRLKSLCRRSCA
ncbi:hypothetical protein JG687_00010061, partial [Phytophthora cactorum]